MKLDAALLRTPLENMADVAGGLEDAGFDGAWVTETVNDAFVSLAPAVLATRRMNLGTAISVAFIRSPMLTAYASWELQRASRGRFILGLGTQVKGHNERRFSVPYEAPVPKLAEQVRALRACWAAFAGTEELDFQGDFYRLDLLPALFRPEPIEYPAPPVYLAAMNPISCRIAGEVADGIHIHPFHSVDYLREVVIPAVEEGLAKSGRSRSDFTLSTQVIVAAGQGEEGRASHRAARQRLAFYGSTRTYRAPLELHGLGDVTPRLHELMARGDTAGMVAALPDEVIREFSVSGETWADVAIAVRQRYEGLLDRVSFYAPPPAAEARSAAMAFAA